MHDATVVVCNGVWCELCRALQEDVSRLLEPDANGKLEGLSEPETRTNWTMFKIVMQRTARDYWRDNAYNYARFMALTVLGVIIGLVFYKARCVAWRDLKPLDNHVLCLLAVPRSCPALTCPAFTPRLQRCSVQRCSCP